jgi:lysozyme
MSMNQRHISDQGLALIEAREGCRMEAYLDSVGVPTIAVGHTAGVEMGQTCTAEQAEAWLRSDVRYAEAAINGSVSAPLEQYQFDALVSFTFQQSTLLRLLNQRDYAGAAKQFDRWHIPKEITDRRNGEKAQFEGSQFEPRIQQAA